MIRRTANKPRRSLFGPCLICGLILAYCFATLPLVQESKAQQAAPSGVIRLRVRVATGDGNKANGLSRKRFFLIKGSLEENKALVEAIEQQSLISRDCYYRGLGASEALIAWLKEKDCESVYCREVEPEHVEGAAAVPEFQQAVAAGEKEFGSRELARKWLAVNLNANLRSGFYTSQQQRLTALLIKAEEVSRAKVLSVMTDSFGTAYFTDIEPGTYTISNLIPTEVGTMAEIWNAEIKVKPGDLATELPFLISNPGNKDPRDKKNIKRVSLEKPLPPCG
ncbi:MAG TPA: hypothetical protein VNO50_21625 [Pyrinomonadaceae bacterium]|nr:hypothetical protein [Pyrinomonadaceae bacterium]